MEVTHGPGLTLTVEGMPIIMRNDPAKDFVTLQLPRSSLDAKISINFAKEGDKTPAIVDKIASSAERMSKPPSFRRARTVSQRKEPEPIPGWSESQDPLAGLDGDALWEAMSGSYGPPHPVPPPPKPTQKEEVDKITWEEIRGEESSKELAPS